RAAESAASAKRGAPANLDAAPARTNRKLYRDVDPLAAPGFTDKTDLLAEIDAYVRARDPRVVQVSASMAASRKQVSILRADEQRVDDHRPLVRVNVSVTVEKDGRRE